MTYIKHKSEESVEDYLETILVLSHKLPEVRSIDIANEMHFSKPSVSVAMKNLRNRDLILVSDNGHISLKSQNAIAEVIDSLAKYSASDLVRVTHGQDPWKNVYHEDEKNIKIGNSAIKEYFDGQ